MADVLLLHSLQFSPNLLSAQGDPTIHPSKGAAPGGSHRFARRQTRSCTASGWKRCCRTRCSPRPNLLVHPKRPYNPP